MATLVVPIETLTQESRITEIPGVGDAIANIITKLYRTGSHPSLEKLQKGIPTGILETVPGFRPDKVLPLRDISGKSGAHAGAA